MNLEELKKKPSVYLVHKTEKGWVAVSDEEPKVNNWFYSFGLRMEQISTIPIQKGRGLHIIATDTSFKLEGVAQFEMPKLDQEYWDEYNKYITENGFERSVGIYGGFIMGYKAAQQKYGFSEEDLRKAFYSQKRTFEEFLADFRQSKVPYAIEFEEEILECEKCELPAEYKECHKDGCIKQKMIPKLTNGLLTVLKWHYA